MCSCGPPHMANQKQDDQLEHSYSSYVMIRDVTPKTCRRRWMTGRRGERVRDIRASHTSWWYIYIYIYIYQVYTIRFQTFFVWALLLIVHKWNSSPLPSNLLRLQCTCCTVLTTSARPHGSPLVWACQWFLSQPLSSPQLSHNDSLWA